MKISKIFIALSVVPVLLSSCDERIDDKSIFWGEIEYYENFPFKPYISEEHRISKTLSFDFNDDADSLVSLPVVFEVVEKNENNESIPPVGIDFYINNVKQADNTFKITTADKEVVLDIEFTPKTKEGNHTLFLRVKNGGGLDYIDDTEIVNEQSNIEIPTQVWRIKKTDVYNPLAFLLFWTLSAIIATLLICYIIIHFLSIQASNFQKYLLITMMERANSE